MAWFPPESTNDTVVFAAVLATVGWLYTARRARTLARKQHTIDIMLKGSFDSEMRKAHSTIAPYLRGAKAFPPEHSEELELILPSLKYVLNHYEFIAAGIRRGDLDERLVMDAQRGSILTAFERCETYIFRVRDSRRNQAVYEHVEWLHKRWEKKPPSKLIRWVERAKGSPFQGDRNHVRD